MKRQGNKQQMKEHGKIPKTKQMTWKYAIYLKKNSEK